jgi:hypothetical protein
MDLRTSRPRPPIDLIEVTEEPMFAPAPDLIQWAVETFIESGATLYNHKHLNFASMGAQRTNVPNGRAGRRAGVSWIRLPRRHTSGSTTARRPIGWT